MKKRSSDLYREVVNFGLKMQCLSTILSEKKLNVSEI